MNATNTDNWQTANQNYLSAALDLVRAALAQYVARQHDQTQAEDDSHNLRQALQAAAAALPRPAALQVICDIFNLSLFEQDVLVLCAGVELEGSLASLCAKAHGDERCSYVTFDLALSALSNRHWGALTPEAPLRYWRLVKVTSNHTVMTQSPLTIDERILHYLTGISYQDDLLWGLVAPLSGGGVLPPSHQKLVDRIGKNWRSRQAGATPIQLCGSENAGKQAIAAVACSQMGMGLSLMQAADLPTLAADREGLARLWEREALLSKQVLLLDCEGSDKTETERALRFVEQLRSHVIVSSRVPLQTEQRSLLRLDVHKPSMAEQQHLWQMALEPWSTEMNGHIETLVMQFDLSPQGIETAVLELKTQTEKIDDLTSDSENLNSGFSMFNSLWGACCAQSRTSLEDLAKRIDPAATWKDLVLPELQTQTLRQVAAHVRQRAKVYETWGFSRKGDRGLGISALFAGMSGTGKTMAAEVLAEELNLDLYRIDLSSVVSKYIGETEKNLRRVFDAAETGGAILLFDEADALFGKRSDVKDSHDRYANIEVSYLLQRMEAYRGLAILTTNLKESLDTAFMRRIRFIVQFPFPDAAQRTEIWRRIFPEDTPTAGLDVEKLGRLNVSGGNIRNIAVNAAFLAADAGEVVQMKHLLASTQTEYTKLEKSLTGAEIGGWV